MKVVILAGGLGTRLAEETEIKPKPMVEIGGHPILWHIMKHYAHYDFKEFYIALGHRGEVIKRFFLDYCSLSGNMTVDLSKGVVDTHDNDCEDWVVHLKNTGQQTNTGGRVKRLEQWLGNESFMVTYGDGVSDVNLAQLLEFHRQHGKLATVTAVRPPARFGGLVFSGDLVSEFTEKPQIGEGWINGGFMVCEPGVFKYLEGDDSSLEADALENLAADKQLVAFRHESFWQCMDTMREVRLLEGLWRGGNAPWKTWQ
jgi:glucose-1-phosphate cytidylyltransferase